MHKNNIENFVNNNQLYIFLALYISLILGFILDENSTGGAYIDYKNQQLAVKSFANNFTDTLLNYENFSTRHSPILIILLSFLEKLNLSDYIIRAIHLHLCLILPLIFYKILIEKFGNKLNAVFIILCGIIFLSPTFRTLSIWPDSRLLGLIFFSLSILFFLKFQKVKKFNYCLYNILFCSISSYISPNFSIFSIFYFLNFLIFYKLLSKEIFIIIFLNIILSLPAIYYIFVLDINFLNKTAGVGIKEDNVFFINIFNNILLSFSIFSFYIIPFILSKIVKYRYFLDYKNIFISILILIILISNFDYNYNLSGGGIIFKFSNFFFNNNLFFYFFSFFSILIVITILDYKILNIFLFSLVILNNPQETIYHKYFDPFLIIIFFSLFFFNFDLKKMMKIKNLIFINTYFVCFLIISNLKFLWNI